MSEFGLGELICDICEFGDDPEDSRFGAVILYDFEGIQPLDIGSRLAFIDVGTR